MKLKISYCVTCHNEINSLDLLLSKLCCIKTTDEIIVQSDSNATNETLGVIDKYKSNITYYSYPLNNDYGNFKNKFIQMSTGTWIFSIDADEMPPESLLGENLHALLESNPTVEAYAIPRINAWHGLTQEHAKQWGWPLDMSPTYKRWRAAWPDYQWRIFRKDYPRISFKKKLHERIDGYLEYSILPAEEDYALYHDKTIETQMATNIRYNKEFTQSENRGQG